jgi:glutamyl-tRNA(Gln) amidotransferase subunit D
MYGKDVSALLDKHGIRVGDTILLLAGPERYEGVLMPRVDVGDSSIIVIKRKDGYNMGIKYHAGMKIHKLAAGKGEFEFPTAGAEHSRSLDTVSLIYTGGTIGSKVDYRTGGVYMLTKPQELLYEVPELQDIANIHVSNLMSIASEDMTCTEWKKIGREVAGAFNAGSKGVMITHGTDTMHYTSAALSFMLQGLNGPVVLTGAQRSSDRGSSDAFMNLICASHIAAKSDVAEVGICMHSTPSDNTCSLIRGVKARKLHTSRRDAFRPVNGSPIATVDIGGAIDYKSKYRKASKHKSRVSLLDGFEEKTALVKFYPNSDPGIIDFYLGKGYRGIILEGTGLGHVAVSPSRSELSWISRIKDAASSGAVVGMTSQCLYGRVNSAVYRNLRMAADAGAVYCEDMMPEVAYVKLGFLLGNYGEKKAREMLPVDIAGEITKRTEYTEG